MGTSSSVTWSRIAGRCAQHDLAQQHQRRVLAVDLARVDAALQEHDRLRQAAGRRRRERLLLRHHDQRQRTSLLGRAERVELHVRRARLQPLEQRERLVVARRRAEGRGLGARQEVRGWLAGGGGRARERQGESGDDEPAGGHAGILRAGTPGYSWMSQVTTGRHCWCTLSSSGSLSWIFSMAGSIDGPDRKASIRASVPPAAR